MENSEVTVTFALTSLPAVVVVVVVTTGCVTVALLGAYFVVQAEVQKRSVVSWFWVRLLRNGTLLISDSLYITILCRYAFLFFSFLFFSFLFFSCSMIKTLNDTDTNDHALQKKGQQRITRANCVSNDDNKQEREFRRR
jgi:hypothetical protein